MPLTDFSLPYRPFVQADIVSACDSRLGRIKTIFYPFTFILLNQYWTVFKPTD